MVIYQNHLGHHDWEHTEAFEQHCKDYESFKLGIHYDFNPFMGHEEFQQYCESEDLLLDNISNYDNESIEKNPHFATNKMGDKTTKPNAWAHPLLAKAGTQSIGSKTSNESNSTITTSPSML
jgi:hypothetical protein